MDGFVPYNSCEQCCYEELCTSVCIPAFHSLDIYLGVGFLDL